VTIEEMRAMTVESLLEFRRSVDEVLMERRKELERQLDQIAGRPAPKRGSQVTPRSALTNGKVAWRYRSKKDPSLGWSGRGKLPRWMRQEMRGTKLRKDDFLVARSAN